MYINDCTICFLHWFNRFNVFCTWSSQTDQVFDIILDQSYHGLVFTDEEERADPRAEGVISGDEYADARSVTSEDHIGQSGKITAVRVLLNITIWGEGLIWF